MKFKTAITLPDFLGHLLIQPLNQPRALPREGPFMAVVSKVGNPTPAQYAVMVLSKEPVGDGFAMLDFLMRQFSSLQRIGIGCYRMSDRDYAKMKLLFGGEE